jgi:hypothetical protein
VKIRSRTNDGLTTSHLCTDFPMRKRVILTSWILSSIQVMIKFLTLRQFICPLSLFLKEIPFASLTNAIDMKIERVLTRFLIGWNRLFSQSKSPLEPYTNNWGLFGKENYLTFDWWKHFLKILRRSEVTINLTRRLKKMEAS